MARTAAAGPALAMVALLLLSPTSSDAQGSPAPDRLPARSGGCAEGALAVGSVCVSKDTASVVSVSQEPVRVGSELFAGCTATAAPRVLSSGAELVRMERTLSCAASKYHTAVLAATVTDSWRAVGGAVEWNTTISSAAPRFWTTEINDAILVGQADGIFSPLVWTGSTTGSRLEAGSSSLDPVPLAEYTGRTYYGRDQWSSNGKGTVMLCSPTGGAACPAHAEATIVVRRRGRRADACSASLSRATSSRSHSAPWHSSEPVPAPSTPTTHNHRRDPRRTPSGAGHARCLAAMHSFPPRALAALTGAVCARSVWLLRVPCVDLRRGVLPDP